MDVRLNKAISMLGICSRRAADKLILSNKIYVNGSLITNLGQKISEGSKINICDNEFIFKLHKKRMIWKYYKPVGLITSHNDEKGRPTVFDFLKQKIKGHIISVGRLDLNSEGLLLITNDSEFARYAENPKNKLKRVYLVRAFGNLSEQILNKIRIGVSIDKINYAPIEIKILRETSGKNHWFECTLYEGKNREIRKIFSHFGLSVNKLVRTQYGHFKLDNMKPNEIRLDGS